MGGLGRNRMKQESNREKTAILELRNIEKSFGDVKVLGGISLSVGAGEFLTLLGSSGCGKTTTLRIIAGLETPDAGEVLLDGISMKNIGPEKRNVNTVFQNYALFPHMSVYDNIAYGLKIKKVNKAEIKKRVTEILSLVQLEGFEKRMPANMSGGQKQRVAIARALINNPKVLLLDEPLGALDLQLRRQMQQELKRLQKKLGITFIYITHDQEEAINMSDTIVVMRDGRFEQIGSPSEIYNHPKTSYVASFVGSANILTGEVIECQEGEAPYVVLATPDGTMVCKKENFHVTVGSKETLAVRSESISVWREPMSRYSLTGTILEKSFVGGMLRIVVSLKEGKELVISRHGIDFNYDIGERVFLEWKMEDAVLVDMEA